MFSRGAHSPRENALRPRFSITAHDGPAALTRRVSPASPGGRHAQPSGGVRRRPSGATNTRGSDVGASVNDSAIDPARCPSRIRKSSAGSLLKRSPLHRKFHVVMFDLAVPGGTLVDGTGRSPFTADIAIVDGRIVAIGGRLGPARRTIDAHGAHVLPGFVDIHTHYDGLVSWDADLAPTSLHGVTTCVMGSCGVGFAPVRRGQEQALVELMEGVEDIP